MFDITEAVKTLFLRQANAVYICISCERIRHLKEENITTPLLAANHSAVGI